MLAILYPKLSLRQLHTHDGGGGGGGGEEGLGKCKDILNNAVIYPDCFRVGMG